VSRNFQPIISRINTSINGACSYELLLKQYMKQQYNSIEEIKTRIHEIKLTRNVRRDMPLYLNRKAHFQLESDLRHYLLLPSQDESDCLRNHAISLSFSYSRSTDCKQYTKTSSSRCQPCNIIIHTPKLA